jgi:anti-sigma factor RsiW
VSHTDFSQLVEYWAGDLAADAESAVEEHAFSCDACARRMTAVGRLAQGVLRTIARRGGFDIVATRSMVEQLERDGLVTRHYRAKLGDVVPCGVGALDDLLVTTIEADLTGVERVSVSLHAGDGRLLRRSDDAPIDRASGQLVYTLAGDAARSAAFEDAVRGGPKPVGVTSEVLTIVSRFSAIEPTGERVLGEVVLQHRTFSV